MNALLISKIFATNSILHLKVLLITFRTCYAPSVRDVVILVSTYFSSHAPISQRLSSWTTYLVDKLISSGQHLLDVSLCGVVQSPSDDLHVLAEDCYSYLREILDKHAPQKRNTITMRPNTEWFNDNVLYEKHFKGQLERHWRLSKLPMDRLLYIDQCRKVDAMCDDARRIHYQSLISQNASNQKELYKIANKLTMRNATQVLAAHDNLEKLCKQFANFFGDKIQKIRSNLVEVSGQFTPCQEPECENILTEFSEATPEEI